MTNPLDDLIKQYEQQLINIQTQKEEAQAQLLSTKNQEQEIKPSDAKQAKT